MLYSLFSYSTSIFYSNLQKSSNFIYRVIKINVENEDRYSYFTRLDLTTKVRDQNFNTLILDGVTEIKLFNHTIAELKSGFTFINGLIML